MVAVRTRLVLVLVVVLYLASLFAAAAPVAAQGAVLPSNIYISNDNEFPSSLTPGVKNEVELSVVYQYAAGVSTSTETLVEVSMTEKPEWLTVRFIPQEFTMPVDPATQSTRKNITAVFQVPESVPALLQTRVTLHLFATANEPISSAQNQHQWFVQAAFIPKLSVNVETNPLHLGADGIESTTITLTNLGNAPVVPQFRLVRTPLNLQVGVANEGRILGTEAEHEVFSVRSRTPLIVQDRGGNWQQESIELEISYKPARKPTHPSSFETVMIQVVHGPGDIVSQFGLHIGLLAIGTAVGGFYLHRRREVLWPEGR